MEESRRQQIVRAFLAGQNDETCTAEEMRDRARALKQDLVAAGATAADLELTLWQWLKSVLETNAVPVPAFQRLAIVNALQDGFGADMISVSGPEQFVVRMRKSH